MKKLLCGAGGFFLYALLISVFIVESYGDPREVCQPRNETYNIADSKQCDKYHECGKSSKGKTLERLCDDGFVFSEEIRACDYPHNVNCTGRDLLQEPKSTNPDCERMNGFYAFPPEDSCQKFYHCLEGKAYEKTCPEGVIFDPSKGTCIHPDLSHRPQCAARAVLNFTCPNYGKKFVRLRFGDHDRLPHTTNCRKFFICLADGKPRVGGCPLGKVFNPKLGVCDSPKRVPQCKDYYGKKDLKKLAKLAELGEEASLDSEQFELESVEEDEDETEVEEVPPPQPVKSSNKGKKFQHEQSKRATSGVEGTTGVESNPSSQEGNGKQSQASGSQGSQSKSSEEEDDSDEDVEDDDE